MQPLVVRGHGLTDSRLESGENGASVHLRDLESFRNCPLLVIRDASITCTRYCSQVPGLLNVNDSDGINVESTFDY